jgi:hypothetical protein
MWKRALIAIGATILVGVLLLFCAIFWIAGKVATADDARTSNIIREEFINASTNIVTGKQMKIYSSPRRAATRLFVYGDLSVKEAQALQSLAVQISQNNSNRPVNIEFHKEIPESINK